MAITVSTEKKTKVLDSLVLDKDVKKVNGKRVKGKKFKLKVDLTYAEDVEICKVEGVFEVGKV